MSIVWDFFDKIENNTQAKCNVQNCATKYAYIKGQSTKNLLYHLQNKHAEVYEDKCKENTTSQTTKDLPRNELDETLTLYVVHENLPLNTVESNVDKIIEIIEQRL